MEGKGLLSHAETLLSSTTGTPGSSEEGGEGTPRLWVAKEGRVQQTKVSWWRPALMTVVKNIANSESSRSCYPVATAWHRPSSLADGSQF